MSNAITINFDDTNRTRDAFDPTAYAQAVSTTLFGGIDLSLDSRDDDVNAQGYQTHYETAFDDLGLTFVRYPDGEMPDGFIRQVGQNWVFQHNKINGGKDPDKYQEFLNTYGITEVDQDFLDNTLIHAFSIKDSPEYAELIHQNWLNAGPGIASFTDAMAFARAQKVPFSLVLPEFQYLKLPVNRDPDGDGVKVAFVLEDHIKASELETDLSSFLERLFIDKVFGEPPLEGFIIELGNEDAFGWHESGFTKDSSHDYDSYSAFAYIALKTIADFRDQHPEAEFKVAIQAQGPLWVNELEQNFDDLDDGGANSGIRLFQHVDIIDTKHRGLDAVFEENADENTKPNVHVIEDDNGFKNGVTNLLNLIEEAGGDRDAVELYNSAWSASSKDVAAHPGTHDLPAAAAALSLFSGYAELGIDHAALWGIGSWNSHSSSALPDGTMEYAHYADVLALMAASLPGAYQLETATKDNGRDAPGVFAFAYERADLGIIYLASNDFVGEYEVTLSGFGPILEVNDTSVGGVSAGSLVNGDTITVTFTEAYSVIELLVTRDGVNGTAQKDTLHGTTGDDFVFAHEGNDLIYTHAGDDVVYGGSQNDKIYTGTGNDSVWGDNGSDNVWLQDGDDLFTDNDQTGSYGHDKIRGGNGNDTILAGGGNDTVWGGNHDDYIEGGVGRDRILGGSGDDTIYAGSGNDDVQGNNGRDQVWLGNGHDLFTDNGQNNYGGADLVYGGSGNDTILGAGGDDTFDGGTGNDSIEGGVGDDLIDGGQGDDRISAGDGNDVVDAGDGDDIVYGNKDQDTISGGTGADLLNGGQGNDVVDGGDGNDHVLGDSGDDELFGGKGSDTLDGGSGADRLNGGWGADTYTGGAGADVFVFDENQTKWWERITDFELGADKIELHIDDVHDTSDIWLRWSDKPGKVGWLISFAETNWDYLHNGSILIENLSENLDDDYLLQTLFADDFPVV